MPDFSSAKSRADTPTTGEGVGSTLEYGGQQGAGPALLQQARGRVSSGQCLDINMASGSSTDKHIHIAFVANMTSDLSIDTGHERIMESDMASGGSTGLCVTVASSSSADHSDQYVSWPPYSLRHQHSLML